MASTSWVRLLSAMTVGSLRTMPRPLRVDEGVGGAEVDGEVPSQSRSLHSLARLRPLLGRQGAQLAVELVDAVLDRRRLPVAQPQHQPADAAQHEREQEIEEIAHRSADTASIGCASVPQSEPPAHVSFFQIGTVALSVSMQ